MPVAVFGFQAPTLLSIFASCPVWDVRIGRLGDDVGCDEIQLLDVEQWDTGAADVFFVTSPMQMASALRLKSPKAKVVWVQHNGRLSFDPSFLDNPIDAVLCMSDRNARQIEAYKARPPVFSVHPAYTFNPVWAWKPEASWTVKSRPWARDQAALEDLYSVIREAHAYDHAWYGQGQPRGFLSHVGKQALLRSCSCYVSCLPEWAGFGLTEHECMAAGVPVVGSRWGDTQQMGANAYLDDDRWCQVEALKRLRASPASQADLDAQAEYIRSWCSPARMREDIEILLGEIL
jgi:hypothetical protein